MPIPYAFSAWYFVAVKHQQRGVLWKITATLCAIVFTIAFIGFEYIARIGVGAGIYEFWFMLGAAFGFVGIFFGEARGKRQKSLKPQTMLLKSFEISRHPQT